MQGLYLSQHAHPDIQTAISFLSSPLCDPDQDDYKKLTCLIQYIQATQGLTLTLGSNGKGQIQWWIDASYAIHVDLKGYTGTTMLLGSGSIFTGSRKEKLVTNSLMESEVIGMYDILPHILWTKKFLGDQGLQLHETIIYQDNTSSILLDKNGCHSSSRHTKHMDVQYFYITNHVENKEISIQHCPTEEMLPEFFYKTTTRISFS